jgi:lysozyme
MKASQKLIDAIKKFEGCSLIAYKCPAGVLTIGYGHTNGVKPGDKITQYQAEQFLREDLAPAEAIASKTRRVLVSQGRFDAVVDFIYNCGEGNWNASTLKKDIEQGQETWKIQEQFMKWVNARQNGVLTKQGGLVSRRIWEANRFNE